MKVALLSIVRPQPGSGEGITEYVYNLHSRISKTPGVEVTPVYPLQKAKRTDLLGLAYSNFFFRQVASELAKRDYDIVHIANEEIAFLSGKIKKTNPKIKVVLTLHGLSRVETGYHRGFVQNAYNKFVSLGIRDALKTSDFVICNSALTRDDALRISKQDRTLKNKIKVIHLGIKDVFLHYNPRRKRTRGGFVVGYVGSFAHLKNVGFILRTAMLLRNEKGIFFDIYGFGSEAENRELRRFAAANGLTNVRFKNFATHQRIRAIYASFDAFIFPSLYEGFGLPILEAQAMGLPVIVYKKGRLSKEVTKYCIKAADEKQAALHVEKIRKMGYDKYIRKKSKAYACSFTWEKTARETIKIYERLAGKVG
jgi:glycosyltransferase involved in cell wall biosynthesis